MTDYHSVFLHCPDMISLHSDAGVYLDVSPSCEILLGYKPNELVGLSAYDFFHPSDLNIIRQSHTTILEDGMGTRLVYRIRKKNGLYIWFESTSRFREDSSAEGGKIFAYSRDVSSRVAFKILQTKLVDEAVSAKDVVQFCAWTSRVQHDGEWISIEEYLKARFGIFVSHGISEDGARRVIEEYQKAKPTNPPKAV